jgi:ERF superfamily
MHQSSSSIGSLAAALAKAQIELVNPEKSMVATIEADSKSGREQIFRYAPLSSGLDIVRKTLGKHEIAAVQATAVDHAAGIISVTTRLCHSSGEWIASDWPVCSLDDMVSPKRMGAALTYARRYALFALVGIAGEDDLDAPDLNISVPALPDTKTPLPNGGSRGAQKYWPQKKTQAKQTANSNSNSRLKAQLSGVLRDQLMSELKGVKSGEDAAIWAKRILPAKNALDAADAHQIEEAFQAKLAVVQPDGLASAVKAAPKAEQAQGSMRESRPASTAKSHLPYPEPRRIRDRNHVRFVTKQPCLICGRRPADPHHLRFTQQRALGRKVSDEFTVPLCRGHHREAHRSGDEAAWWKKAGVDPTITARALWLATHPLPTRADKMGSASATSLASADAEQNGKPNPPLSVLSE